MSLAKLPSKLEGHALSVGKPYPFGATLEDGGVNFAVFSEHATCIELCVFSEDGDTELARIPLRERDGDVWHVHVAGLGSGTTYGYRAHGRFQPAEGHRFNPHKLLIDPYAKQLVGELRWCDELMGHVAAAESEEVELDERDSAHAVPKSVVIDPSFDWGDDERPNIAPSDTVIYEAHVKGLTKTHPDIDPELAGTYLALASEPMVEHLKRLGVTTLELLPVHAFLDDQFLVEKGLSNFWGYQSLGFFAPEPRYMAKGEIREFQTMVRTLHAAGIEVVLDVVYNHTGEGNELGPTLAFRGLDNRSYYRLKEDCRRYVDDTGCGNTLNITHPMVLRMVLDSLRYWVEVMHVDGFRFDLATTLGREQHGFDPAGGFLDALRQDPVLARVKLIAEPWDLGPGGYQLGAWPHPVMEWNDKYRDGLRKFWRGDAGATADMAKRLLGSSEQFDHSGRSATSSINFLTAHDGFTLEDLVSYTSKQNLANGEEGQDGKDENYSDNLGVEGPSSDPAIRTARDLRKRNMLATLFLSQGVPMLLAGDELGNTQGGNNNGYAQDNLTSWIDWSAPDTSLIDFTCKLSALRRAHPVLRQRLFLHSRPRTRDGMPDVCWRLPTGDSPTVEDWHGSEWKALCVELRTSSATPEYAASDDVIFAILNVGDAVDVQLPECPNGHGWELLVDTTEPEVAAHRVDAETIVAPAHCVLVFALAGERSQ